jgi:valyl-tRNA synthetase
VKNRVGFAGEPSAKQRSALYTLHHATLTIIRLFAPFIPFVTDTLYDLFQDERGHADTIHASGKWPKLEDQVDPSLCRELGDAVIDIIAAARKVKSDLEVSLGAPVRSLTISPGRGGPDLDQIKRLLGGSLEDIRLTLNARALVWAHDLPQHQPNALSPGDRFRVALHMAEPENLER